MKRARRWPLAEALPLIVFGGTCLGLAGWLAGSHTQAYLGHYTLWPYLATIGGISAAGGTASLFATWEEETEPAERTIDPNEVVLPRDEYESLIRSALAEKAAARLREERAAPSRPPAASTAAATGTARADPAWSEASSVTPSSSHRTADDWVEAGPARAAPGVAPEEPTPSPAPPAPSRSRDTAPAQPSQEAPLEAGAHAAEAAPQLVLQSFLARLKPAAESSTPTTASTPAAPSAPPPSAPSAGAHEGRPPEPRGEAATPARRSDLAAADAGGTTAAPPAEKVSSEEIEHEFDQLLEALSSGNAPGAPSGEPLCISCDKPVQLPYVSCQGCGNPLCAECRAAAAEEGHPRRCPTCALLQKYSQ